MTAGLPEELKDQYRNSIPLGRFGKAEEVASLVTFLLSPSPITSPDRFLLLTADCKCNI